jgi:SAM-dependent methyltransferase
VLGELKTQVGRRYRHALSTLGHAAFERGLQSTERSDVSSGHLFLARALRGRRIGREDVFLDYGCGSGRVILHAARRPFGRVIGLDMDAAALSIARENAERFTPRMRAGRLDVLEADATEWQVPDDVSYIYMYNPFWGDVFTRTLQQVCDSLDRAPRPLEILYAYPTCAEQVMATGRFERVRVSRGGRPDRPQHRIDVFRAT